MAASDQLLLADHVNGDPQAFGELVRRHRDRLWRVAQRITRDADDAEDAVHNGLIRAFENAGQFRGDAAVGSWLYRIVTNAALDLVMKAPLGGEPTLDETEVDHPVPDVPVDLRIALHTSLMALDPKPRAAFFLVVLRDLSYSEAAELLGVPIGTAKVWVWRARGRLAEYLRDAR